LDDSLFKILKVIIVEEDMDRIKIFLDEIQTITTHVWDMGINKSENSRPVFSLVESWTVNQATRARFPDGTGHFRCD
jgi:hypothetical protein